MVRAIRSGAIGCAGPKSYSIRLSSKTAQAPWRDPAHGADPTPRVRSDALPTALARGQVPRAVASGLHGGEERGADLVVLELAYGRGRRAARRGHPLAQHGRVLTGLAQQLGRADDGLDDQLGGRAARQPQVHAGLDHRLDDEEQVRRTGPADRGDGVLLLLGHPDHPAGRRQQLSTSARCASSHDEPREIAAMPSSTSAGVLGMTRTTGMPAGSRASMNVVVMPAASDTTRPAGRQVRRHLVEHVAHVLRLDHEHQRVGLAGGVDVADDLDAVPLVQLGRPLRPPLGQQQLVGSPAGPQQPRHQRLAHHSRAQHGHHSHAPICSPGRPSAGPTRVARVCPHGAGRSAASGSGGAAAEGGGAERAARAVRCRRRR